MFSSLSSRIIIKNLTNSSMRASSLSRAVLINARYFATIRKFTSDHEWIEYNTDTKEGTIGITNFAQSELGDIVHVDMPEIGSTLHKGDTACGIESVKTAADVYSPVSGDVIKQNDQIAKDPALLNHSAEKEGWLFRVKVNDP